MVSQVTGLRVAVAQVRAISETAAAIEELIIDPFGEVLAGPLHDEEGLLYAELDLAQVTRGRYDFDATGHYSRPDIFTLAVDTRARQPVEWDSESPNARGNVLGDAR
jgi:predicted amidohydrolase